MAEEERETARPAAYRPKGASGRSAEVRAELSGLGRTAPHAREGSGDSYGGVQEEGM